MAPKLAVVQSSAVNDGANGAGAGRPFPALQASPEVTATGKKKNLFPLLNLIINK